MSATTIRTRRFTREFTRLRLRPLQVTDRGEVIGTWTPATRRPKDVDFLARAQQDCKGKAPFSFAELLKEGKKR
jgi:hypothetical protein